MKCKICNNETKVIFNREILNKYPVNYNQCTDCGFIQTDEPFWLDEAYKNPINIDDTGLVARNILLAKRSAAVLFFQFNRNKKFLDFAGGYGLFTRLMRDYGFDFYWTDPYTPNLFARGFEIDLSSQKNKFEAVTVFECFEHFVDPIAEIEKLLKFSKNILFSTEIFSSGTPKPDEWEYYSFNHGQHISFYSLDTLKYIKDKFGLHLCTNGKSFHLLSVEKMNNFLFSALLKISLMGIPLLIKLRNHTKTLSDSLLLKDKRNLKHTNSQ